MNKKRRVYFSAIQVKITLTGQLQEDRAAIKEKIFDPIVEKYNEAREECDFSCFQKKIQNSTEIFMVSMLHYEGNVLCGIVSHGSPRIERYLRECNPETFSVKELIPDAGNVFEEYSFFAISIQKMQIAYLSDAAVSTNIPALVIRLLAPTLDAHYQLEECTVLDADIKAKIKQLGSNVRVKGVIKDNNNIIIGGYPSFQALERKLATKFNAIVKLKARLTKRLSDEDIDEILNTTAEDSCFSSFTFEDADNPNKEIIDVIKKHIRYYKIIELSAEERQIAPIIWGKLCTTFN